MKQQVNLKTIRNDFFNIIKTRSLDTKWSKILTSNKIWRKKLNFYQQTNQFITSIKTDSKHRSHLDFKRMITLPNTINQRVLLKITLLLRMKSWILLRELWRRMLMITIEVENFMNLEFIKLEATTLKWPKTSINIKEKNERVKT